MFAKTFKSGSKIAFAMSIAGLAGCAGDGGLGEVAMMGALLLPVPAGFEAGLAAMDPGLVAAGTGLAVLAYGSSSLGSEDTATAPSQPYGVTAPQGLPPTDLQQYVSRETPDRYRVKSCEYIEASLLEVPLYQASTQPAVKQVGEARKAAASKVWLEKGCQPSSLPRGKIGISMDSIDPQRAMALSLPLAGVVVLGTVTGSGAQQAGILPGDVIVTVGNQAVADTADLRVEIAKAPIGSSVSLKLWRSNAFTVIPVVVGAGESQVSSAPSQPVSASAGAAVAMPAAPVSEGMYCHAVLATQHVAGATGSTVKLIEGAADGMQPSLTNYIAKVKQEQPNVWGDFSFKPGLCSPGAPVCMAEAKGPTGKTQNAFEFCHSTQAQADAQLSQMRQADPKSVIVDWP